MKKNKTYIQKKDKRPWGEFKVLASLKVLSDTRVNTLRGEDVVIKKLVIKPGQMLSYQSHKLRREHWIVVQGYGKIILDDYEQILFTGQSIVIQAKQKHRIKNPDTNNDLIVIEVSTGIFNEEDNTRYEDVYKRN